VTRAKKHPSASDLISKRIAELGDWRGATLERMRSLIKAAVPAVVEEWKWMGTPVWSRDGIICTGETYKSVVKLTFIKGASLRDPARLFNASLDGNARRAIDLHEGEKINQTAFKALVRAAVALNLKARAGNKPSGAGYSGTPLALKLGLAPGQTILLLGAPANYPALVGPTLSELKPARKLAPTVDIVHLFTASRSRLATALLDCRRQLRGTAVIWVSWPKKASGVRTDITENTIREIALPMGFVDIKVCAVDATWSGLKLMVRKELRQSAGPGRGV